MLDQLLPIGGLILFCFLGFTIAQRKLWGKKKHWQCERCGRKFSEGWLMEFHHKVPRHLGGPDEESNSELLCMGCHAIRHREIESNARISAELIERRLKKTHGRVSR